MKPILRKRLVEIRRFKYNRETFTVENRSRNWVISFVNISRKANLTREQNVTRRETMAQMMELWCFVF